MKYKIWVIGLILMAVTIYLVTARPDISAVVPVTGEEYADGEVLIRVYSVQEGSDGNWVLMGTSAEDTRLTLLDKGNRAVLSTTGYADARHDGPVRVRIERLQFGLVWVPESLVSFEPAGELPLRTSENAAAIAEEFRTALSR